MDTQEIRLHIRMCVKSLYELAHIAKDSFHKKHIMEQADVFFDSSLFFIGDKTIQPLIVRIEILRVLLPLWGYALKLQHTNILEIQKNILLIKRELLSKKQKKDFQFKKGVQNKSFSNILEKKIEQKVFMLSDMNALQSKIVSLLNRQGRLSTARLCGALEGVNKKTLRRNIAPLINTGTVRKIIDGKEAFYEVPIS